ncbi:YrhB domain-containing protein [Streptomyces graminifolii]|uniref:YrhB domain-containing protein n=1 Tax=Streptomyces graminifolii TaxID=1266771 RepID=UPI0040593B09
MEYAEALRIATEFLKAGRQPGEALLAINLEEVTERDRQLIVPCNSTRYLTSRDDRKMLLDCWTMLINLTIRHASSASSATSPCGTTDRCR